MFLRKVQGEARRDKIEDEIYGEVSDVFIVLIEVSQNHLRWKKKKEWKKIVWLSKHMMWEKLEEGKEVSSKVTFYEKLMDKFINHVTLLF